GRLRGRVAIDGGAGGQRLDVAVGAVAVDGGALLVETVRDLRDLMPAVAVEGDADEEFGRGNACNRIGRHAVFDRADMVGAVAGERGAEAGGVSPASVEVVGLQADLGRL